MRNCGLILIGVFLLLSSTTAGAQQVFSFEVDQAEGVMIVSLTERTEGLMMEVSKGEVRYHYNLRPNRDREIIPLQMGPGGHKVSALEHIEGSLYRYIQSEYFTLDSGGYNFLASTQQCPWRESQRVMEVVCGIIEDHTSVMGRLREAHDFITSHIKYSLNMTSSPGCGDPEKTLLKGYGNCYDYSVTLSALLRGMGIPCKVVVGYADTCPHELHAWTEVMVEDKWCVVDATVDACLRREGVTCWIFKCRDAYHGLKEY